MRVVGQATLASITTHGAVLHIAGGHLLHITALEEDMIRIRMDRNGKRAVCHSWMVAPCGSAAPHEGRDKDDLRGFALPHVHVEVLCGILHVSTSRLRVLVPLDVTPLALRWEWHDIVGATWRPLLADRRTGAYYFGRWDERLSHHLQRRRGDRFFGLGEKSGALDKAGRRFRMDCLDAMGYDAERSDPLYKFWPFYIAKPAPSTPTAHSAAYGVLYDNLATCTFDLGCTFDNYHGLFTSYEAGCGDLDYTVILGPSVLQVAFVYHPTWFPSLTCSRLCLVMREPGRLPCCA